LVIGAPAAFDALALVERQRHPGSGPGRRGGDRCSGRFRRPGVGREAAAPRVGPGATGWWSALRPHFDALVLVERQRDPGSSPGW